MTPPDSSEPEDTLPASAFREALRRPPEATSQAARSVMQGNKRRDTRPELLLRRELHARGHRFRVEHPIRVGSMRAIEADVIFTRWRVVVFVDGCFWHGCPDHGTRPRSNSGYWSSKIASNQARDRRQTAALEGAGWSVVRVWEHEAVADAADRVEAALAVKQPR